MSAPPGATGASGDRPDPDALLRRVHATETRARRGKLKIFFGFAPGVGKTYRMLQVARDLVADQGLDVVVGLVETHGRYDTGTLLLGLQLLPRRVVDHRGRSLQEFDLDAALTRRPGLLIVDELAHTNAPGSRHGKRWQDVIEVLEAGIDVFTTLNVQHLESLNDIVAQITHVQVRETVPDNILDQADAVELVDIAPEELLARLNEGKVYLPEQARRAVNHFFQRGNLLALRELALRRTAQHVDEDVQEYREEHGVQTTWPLGERILVCVGPAPSSALLIRSAARMAAGLRCPWTALYVEPLGLAGLTEPDRQRLESHLRLAESLGATVSRLSAPRVGEAMLAYARKHNVTRIVVGKPTHSRLRDRLRGSFLDQLVRGSASMEVHVISGAEGEARDPAPRGAPGPAPTVRSFCFSVALVALTTGLAAGARTLYAVPDIEILYLLAVLVSAVWLGRVPSLVTAALGVAAYDFFFVPPYFTLAVTDARYILTFGMMFGVGLLVSELTSRLRRQERDALSREARTAALYALSRELGGQDEAAGLANAIARHATDSFSAAASVLARGPDGDFQILGGVGLLNAKDLSVARWCFEHEQLAGRGTDTLPGAGVVCSPLRVGARAVGVLALALHSQAPLGSEQREFLDVFCRQAASALERVRLAEEARVAALRAKTEEMRSSLLSAVSHDLRTPLAAITGAATSLRDDGLLAAGTRNELLESICEEAERMERLVANLLEMTRLEAGIALRREWVPLEEVVGSALTRLEQKLEGRPVSIELAPDLPLVSMDPVLFEQIFVNLLENAAKYTPPGSPLEIRARRDESGLLIEVLDRGPGLAEGAEERVFEKFYRGAHVGVAGVGLGLPICRGIARAHGGDLKALQRAGGGALFQVTLPSTGAPPVLLEGQAVGK